jgi:hypothetical protein
MNIIESLLYGRLSFLVLLSGYISLFIGLYYFGYSQGHAKCDSNNETSINVDQYRGGIAGIVIGCIFIIYYHVRQMYN